MTINSNTFINKTSTLLANSSLSGIDIDKAIISSITFNKINSVISVVSTSNLPNATDSKGKMIYVTGETKYYYSDGTNWVTDFTPNYVPASFLLFGVGRNDSGQLGDFRFTNRSSPVSVVGGFTDWCQVSASEAHTLAVRTNGTLWAWGNNGQGRLGTNDEFFYLSPASVVGGFTDWYQVSAGQNHTAAVRGDGTLWTWGAATNGRLGDNTTVSKSSPVSVVGGITDWCQVSAGGAHTVAIRRNATLYTWGANGQGRLGDNTTTARSSPILISVGFSDWCQVSAGGSHTSALRTNGTIWTWGSNTCGRLGDGTTVDKSSPVSVLGGFTDWCQVSAGSCHTAAVRTNGTLWTWGINNRGQLGDGTGTAKCSPVSVVGGFTDWCDVSAGGCHTAAIRTNGTIWSWGYNRCGALGDGTTVSRSSPVSLIYHNTTGSYYTPVWSKVATGYAQIFSIVNDIAR